MKISIIVPVYNVNLFLKDCLNSIINGISNEKNIELLLIDDGSNDTSEILVDEYSKKYQFIKSYHKSNGGLSDARNYGLLKASGEYVIFIDSDDMVDSREFNTILEKLEKFKGDILLWDAIMIDDKGKKLNSKLDDYYVHYGLSNNSKYTGLEIITLQLNEHFDFATTVWLGAYKRNFLIENQLWFEKGLLHEDEMWSIKTFITSEHIQYIDKVVYLYRQRNDSIMNKKNRNYEKNINDIIYIYSTLYSFIKWKISDTKLLKKINGNISRRYLHSLAKFDVYRYKKELKKINYLQLLKNSKRNIDKIRSMVLIISPKLYCKISKINN